MAAIEIEQVIAPAHPLVSDDEEEQQSIEDKNELVWTPPDTSFFNSITDLIQAEDNEEEIVFSNANAIQSPEEGWQTNEESFAEAKAVTDDESNAEQEEEEEEEEDDDEDKKDEKDKDETQEAAPNEERPSEAPQLPEEEEETQATVTDYKKEILIENIDKVQEPLSSPQVSPRFLDKEVHALGSNDCDLLLNKSTLKNGFRLFVLLLQPKLQKFELLQILLSGNVTVTVGNVLKKIPAYSSNKEFQLQCRIGFLCPETDAKFFDRDEILIQRKVKTGEFYVSPKLGSDYLLAGIPRDYSMGRMRRKTDKILASPAYRMLRGNFAKSDAAKTKENELELLRKQGLTRSAKNQFVERQKKNDSNQKAYEECAKDLERRKSSTYKPRPNPTLQSSPPVATAAMNPLTGFAISQSQLKKKQKAKERQAKLRNQRHCDTSWANASLSSLNSGKDGRSTTKKTKNQTKEERDKILKETGGVLTPSTTAALATHKKANELNKLREQGVAKKANQIFAEKSSSKKTPFPLSLEPTQKENKEKRLGLASSGPNKSKVVQHFSFKGQKYSDSDPAKPSNNITMTTVQTKSSFSTIQTQNSSLEEEMGYLREKGLTKSMNEQYTETNTQTQALIANDRFTSSTSDRSMNAVTPPEAPVVADAECPATGSKKAQDELEGIRQKGLAKSLNKQYTEEAIKNEQQSEAHLEQQRDLEKRKARTSDFVPSKNVLSAADKSFFLFTKRKKEGARKERETVGFYRKWSDSGTAGPPSSGGGKRHWKVIGTVLTTLGGSKGTMTKSWKARDEQGMTKEATAPQQVDQGCGCVIL